MGENIDIQKTLNDKKLEIYDFTEDWKGLYEEKISDEENKAHNKYKELPVMKKYFTYKLADSRKKPKDIYEKTQKFWDVVRDDYSEPAGRGRRYYILDPDTYSPLLQEIYKNLWSEDMLEHCKKNKGQIIYGDTMNSIQTTLGRYVYLFYKDDSRYYKSEESNVFTNVTKEEDKVALVRNVEIYCDENESEFLKSPEKKTLIEFIKCNHTLGNFIPVPVGCNRPRGLGPLKDYWDLTLKVIYDYYEGNDHISDITGTDVNLQQRYKNWLDSFKVGDNGWNSFVEKNYMQDFVEMDSKRGYGMPKELWKGHFLQFEDDRKAKPKTEEQAREFFINASAGIMKRSYRMMQELETRIRNAKN